MDIAELRGRIVRRDYQFSRLFHWRSHEGRMVPALRRDVRWKEGVDEALFIDASVLFIGPTPCLLDAYAQKFDILCEGDS